MPRQRIHREWFRPVERGGRKSCPNCKAKLEPGECIWSWGEYHNAKWHSVQDVCKSCWPKAAERLRVHQTDCPDNCVIELVCKGTRPPAWMTLGEPDMPLTEDNHLRTWQKDDFRLELWDTFTADSYGKSILGYEFYHKGELLFRGEDFHCSPLHAVDSDCAVGGLLSFLSLKPGDTDREYFDSYTPRQLEWCQQYGEELSLFAMELEEHVGT